MAIEFREIAQRLSCEEFAKHEMIVKHGRAQCPFHGGRDFNLAFFKRDGKCHCFVCGAGGDVVTLAAAVWHTTQLDAAERLNRDFQLGLDDNVPNAAVIQQRQSERQREQAAQDEARQRQEKKWLDHCDEFLKVADDFRLAREALAHCDIDSESGQAAVEKALELRSKYCSIWFAMTGEYPDNVPLQGW